MHQETPEERQARLKAYYERKRKRRNAMQRHNYKTNPRVKRKRDAAQRKYEVKKRKERRKEDAYQRRKAKRDTGYLWPPGKAKRGRRMCIDLSDGTEKIVRLYTLKDIGDALKVTADTVRDWLKRGVLPKPLYYDGPTRLYTYDQILMFVEVFDTYNYARKWPWALSPIPPAIHAEWAEMPDGFRTND